MAYANPRSDVSVYYANSRSLVKKINQLELEIATYQYDLMVFYGDSLGQLYFG